MTPGLRALSVCLSFLAGYVDAVGYLRLGGPFVSFMSGNSTQLGVGVGSGAGLDVLAAVVGLFVAGVAGAALLRRVRWGRVKWGRPGAVMLCVVTGLLLAGCVLPREGRLPWALVVAVMAMGAVNVVFERAGQVRVGLTYMTGTLVRLAEGLAEAVCGGARWGWVGDLALWAGLVAGAVLGGVVYGWAGLGALWGAAGIAGGVTVGAAWLEGRLGDGHDRRG